MMDTESLIKQMQDMIIELDGRARLVSNMRSPRTDNDYGRAAQQLEELIDTLERMRL